jgi:hypothetical protein
LVPQPPKQPGYRYPVIEILANSFTKAILISVGILYTLAASATFMDGARCVPAVITDWYSVFTFGLFQVEPEVTFSILSTVCSLSPGLFSRVNIQKNQH